MSRAVTKVTERDRVRVASQVCWDMPAATRWSSPLLTVSTSPNLPPAQILIAEAAAPPPGPLAGLERSQPAGEGASAS
jgi:hypothetical protein